jgi:hypothetical protein
VSFPLQGVDAAALLRGLGNDSTADRIPGLFTLPLVLPVAIVSTQASLPQPKQPAAFMRAIAPLDATALRHSAVSILAARELVILTLRTTATCYVEIFSPLAQVVRPFTSTLALTPRSIHARVSSTIARGYVGNGGLFADLSETAAAEIFARGWRVPIGHRLTICNRTANQAVEVEVGWIEVGDTVVTVSV